MEVYEHLSSQPGVHLTKHIAKFHKKHNNSQGIKDFIFLWHFPYNVFFKCSKRFEFFTITLKSMFFRKYQLILFYF